MGTGAHYVGCLTVTPSQINSDFTLLYKFMALVHLRAFVGKVFVVLIYPYIHTLTKNPHRPLDSKVIAKNVSNLSLILLRHTYTHRQKQLIHTPVACKPSDI